jgi:hypothetical protein
MEQFDWMKLIIVRVSNEVTRVTNEKLDSSIFMDINILSIPTNEFFTEAWISRLIIRIMLII